MAKAKTRIADLAPKTSEGATLRDRFELILFIVVEVLCLLLFVDFLFFGFYVK
jgi:hypothetical protein